MFLIILCVAFVPLGSSTPYGYGRDEYAAAKQAGLDRHNMYRSWHGMPAMGLNEELSDSAEEWASILASGQQTGHSPKEWRNRSGEPLGENLYHYWSTDTALHADLTEHFLAAVDGWYYELCDGVKYPRFDANGDWNLNHNTQVLWRDSVEVGMGFATHVSGGKTMVEVAAHYLPTGNWEGEEEGNSNLGPPICHTEQEICSAFAAEEPLEGACEGNEFVPAQKPEVAEASQESEKGYQINTPDELPWHENTHAEGGNDNFAQQPEKGSMQPFNIFSTPFSMNGGLFDSMLGSMNDRMKGNMPTGTKGGNNNGDINAYREGDDSQETSTAAAENDENSGGGDSNWPSDGSNETPSVEESGSPSGAQDYYHGMNSGMKPLGGITPFGGGLNNGMMQPLGSMTPFDGMNNGVFGSSMQPFGGMSNDFFNGGSFGNMKNGNPNKGGNKFQVHKQDPNAGSTSWGWKWK